MIKVNCSIHSTDAEVLASDNLSSSSLRTAQDPMPQPTSCETSSPAVGSQGTPGSTGVSAKKLASNQANAQKSTGPRTARGKQFSRENSCTHGLLSGAILYHSNGQLRDPGMAALAEELLETYGRHDLRVQIAVDRLIVALHRERTAIKAEKETVAKDLQFWVRNLFGPELRGLHRYSSANQRTIDRLLAELNGYLAEQLAQCEEESWETADEPTDADVSNPPADPLSSSGPAVPAEDSVPHHQAELGDAELLPCAETDDAVPASDCETQDTAISGEDGIERDSVVSPDELFVEPGSPALAAERDEVDPTLPSPAMSISAATLAAEVGACVAAEDEDLQNEPNKSFVSNADAGGSSEQPESLEVVA